MARKLRDRLTSSDLDDIREAVIELRENPYVPPGQMTQEPAELMLSVGYAEVHPSGEVVLGDERAFVFVDTDLGGDTLMVTLEEAVEGVLGLEDPNWMARRSGIYILGNRELAYVLVTRTQLVGAYWTTHDSSVPSFGFDIAIAPEAQGRGYGAELLDSALDDFEDYRDADPDYQLDLDVINPHLAKMLHARGWEQSNAGDYRQGIDWSQL